jgi:hypothetical protein
MTRLARRTHGRPEAQHQDERQADDEGRVEVVGHARQAHYKQRQCEYDRLALAAGPTSGRVADWQTHNLRRPRLSLIATAAEGRDVAGWRNWQTLGT